MAASFPGNVKNFTRKQNLMDTPDAVHINDLQDEVVAIEQELLKSTGSVIDHGALAGLGDNDHPQYAMAGHNHDTQYASVGHNHDSQYASTSHNHNSVYLGINARAKDSEKLGGALPSSFASSGHNHNGVYVPVSDVATTPGASKIPKANSSGKLNENWLPSVTPIVMLANPVKLVDGTAPVSATYTVTLSRHGIPSAATAVLLRLSGLWTVAHEYENAIFANPSTAEVGNGITYLIVRANVADRYFDANGFVKTNNGQFIYTVMGSNLSQAFVQILGYIK